MCGRCGLPFPGAITESFECSNCRELDLQFEWARAAVVANDVVLELIHRYKYHRALCFEPLLVRLLVRAARAEVDPGNWDMIVPVPLHPLRKREREFNQAERLARRLGRALRIPVRGGLVRRVGITRSQTTLSRRERAQNMHRAFAARPEENLDGCRIILVDDVLTTGATTSACASPLKAAGAAEIGVWTFARGT
jgi:ComF family protein